MLGSREEEAATRGRTRQSVDTSLTDVLGGRAASVRRAARERIATVAPRVRALAGSLERLRRPAAVRVAPPVSRYQDDLSGLGTGDRRHEIVRLSNLGSAYRRAGELADAQICAARALEVAREIGDARLLGLTLNGLGLVQSAQPLPAPAVTAFEEAREIFRTLGDRQIEGQILANLGNVYSRLGDRQTAKATWAEALSALAPDSSAHESLAAWLASHPDADPAEDETAERQPVAG